MASAAEATLTSSAKATLAATLVPASAEVPALVAAALVAAALITLIAALIIALVVPSISAEDDLLVGAQLTVRLEREEAAAAAGIVLSVQNARSG